MKKLFIGVLVIALSGLALTGCSLQQKVGNAANTVVTNYCTKPVSERAVIRMWIDGATTPNQIRIQCAADIVNQQATQ